HRRPGPECQRERSDRRGADPPPRGRPDEISVRRRAHRRTGADVGREHGREDETWTETAARDEEVRGTAHPPADPDAERHQAKRVSGEDREMETHRGGDATKTRKPETYMISFRVSVASWRLDLSKISQRRESLHARRLLRCSHDRLGHD